MTFKPTTWYPIAILLSVVNLLGAGLAATQGEPLHATIHVVLAAAFGVWAHRLLRQAPGESDVQARLDALEGEVGKLGQEMSETQERLDFAERLLAQEREPRRMGPQ